MFSPNTTRRLNQAAALANTAAGDHGGQTLPERLDEDSVEAAQVDGVLHLGPRPTFAGLPPSIELHLFDFDGDIYGERVAVRFVDRIRDIARFDSVEALVHAMEADCQLARSILAKTGRR